MECRVETPRAPTRRSETRDLTGRLGPSAARGPGHPLEVIQQVMFWYRPTNGLEPFLPARFPIFIWEPEDGNMFYGFPAQDDDRGVKAAFFQAGGSPTDETIDGEYARRRRAFSAATSLSTSLSSRAAASTRGHACTPTPRTSTS